LGGGGAGRGCGEPSTRPPWSQNRQKATLLGLDALRNVTIVDADLTAGPAALAAALAGADAVVCAAGARPGPGSGDAAAIDEAGTIALINAAVAQGGVRRFVLLSSILTNGAAIGQTFNPAYLFLEYASGHVLTHKLAAERALRGSGLDWGVLRPGGLSSEPAAAVGAPVLSGEDTLMGRPSDPGTAVSRDTVAAVLVAMIGAPGGGGKVVELVASRAAPEPADLAAALAAV